MKNNLLVSLMVIFLHFLRNYTENNDEEKMGNDLRVVNIITIYYNANLNYNYVCDNVI